MDGSSHIVGDIAALCDALDVVGGTPLALGDAGLLVAAVAAARTDRDMAFWRDRRKDHGTRKQLEGATDCGPFVAIGPRSLCAARSPDLDVAAVLSFADLPPASATPGRRPMAGRTRARPTAIGKQPVDHGLLAAVERLAGDFIRQNGTWADYYYDTLPPAHDNRVLSAVADRIAEDFPPATPVYGIHSGGVCFAAVLADRLGANATMVKPKELRENSLAPGVFVDDFVLTGADMLGCERAVCNATGDNCAFISLYGTRPSTKIDNHEVRALAVLDQGGKQHADRQRQF